MNRSLTTLTATIVGLAAGAVLATSIASAPVAGGAEPVPTSVPATTAPTPTVAPPSSTTTVPPDVGPTSLRQGARGEGVWALQRRLQALGYWLDQPDGTYGSLTAQAVMAFQKVSGLERDGVAGPGTLAALEAATRPHGRSTSGNLVEVDKERQVLLVIRGGKVEWVVNASTGTEEPYEVNGRTETADTPPGRWTVAWAEDGVDWGELGGLYRPRYFHADGIAVHGYHDVPAYPASHGCVRVTDEAMDWIWSGNVMPLGSTVWVY